MQRRVSRSMPAETADFISPRVTDENVLRAWRAECPELRALWGESAPVTAWKGVTFGETGGANGVRVVRVVRIALEKRGLTGDVPAALGGLTALTWLNLEGNQLTSVPAELGGLTALTGLSLSRNRLTSVPGRLGGLTALTSLDLGRGLHSSTFQLNRSHF
jgi:Leucine-rich repeat (LRR) protein